MIFTLDCNASLLVLVSGNDAEALDWLDNVKNYDPSASGSSLLVKDDSDNGENVDAGVLTDANWEFDGGNQRSGTWTITSSETAGIEYWWIKFDGMVAIYEYDGPGSSPFSDSYDLDAEVWNSTTQTLAKDIVDSSNTILVNAGTTSSNGKYTGGGKTFNAKAATSHISTYGQLTGESGSIPEPASLFTFAGLAACGGLGFLRRKKKQNK